MKRRAMCYEVLDVLVVVAVSVLVAMGLHVFVYKANFAPSGVDGLATMLQYASVSWFGVPINAGVFTLILNTPLLIAAWFVLKKRYVLYTILYTVVVSVTLMILAQVNFIQYDCLDPALQNSDVVAAVFGGAMQGVTGVLLRLGGSSGGVDVIGCMIQKRLPHKDVEKIISSVSYLVVVIAYFVYGDLHAVCLSVISIFVCERVTSAILKTNRSAVKFEIVADPARVETIKECLLQKLGHGATLLSGTGMYSGTDKAVILCLVSYRQLPELLQLLRQLPDVFLYYSDVTGVRGNFDFRPENSRR